MIICSKEDEEKSHIISKLHLYRRPAVPGYDKDSFKQYLVSHYVHSEGEEEDQEPDVEDAEVYASTVDLNK